MKLFNLFKSKKSAKTPNHYYSLYNKIWAVEESIVFQTQAVAEEKNPYGWTFEIRWKDTNTGDWYPWTTYWNRKIYYSAQSANEAAISALKGSKHEWRIKPLYTMEQQEYRNFKIDKLLSGRSYEPKKYELMAWKVKKDCQVKYDNGNIFNYKKGTLFIQLERGDIIQIENTTKNRIGGKYQLFNDLIPGGFVQEVKIEDEKWSHPHLLKEIKNKLKI
jgi:hypothetical protein